VLEFAHPLALLAIPLPLLAWWLLPPQRERVSALRVPFFAQIAAAAGSEARAGAVILRRRWLQLLVATLVWLLLVAGLAKPEWVGEPIVRTEAARDIMLALDLSGSMDYYDFPGEDGTDISHQSLFTASFHSRP
jgi:Ca-activated chloride channel family protein